MKKIPLVDLKKQYKSIKKEIDNAIKKVIDNTSFINGKENELFEKEFAEYCGAKYAVGVGSGSMALDFALEALGVKEDDEVICPSHTFTATAESIVRLGGKPVFVDVDEETYNLDSEKVEKKVTKKTVGIIAVHLYGQPADMDRINKIARKEKLWVVEDAAQAHGSLYKGKKVGSLGDIACFSFFPAKNLGCFGDGGAVVTNNRKLAQKVDLLKDHGRFDKYNHKEIGYGGRLDNLQAAILRVKLKYLHEWNKKRRKIAKKYSEELNDKYIVPHVSEGATPVYYVYTLRSNKRNQVLKNLENLGISTGIYYPKPLHLQKAYQFLGYKKGDLPVTERVCREIFSIPMYPELTDKQIKRVINASLEATS